MSKVFAFTMAVLVATSTAAAATQRQGQSVLGFSLAASSAERALEKKYDATLNKRDARLDETHVG